MTVNSTPHEFRPEIKSAFASCPHILVGTPYHSKLPSDLEAWHCYLADCGHCIMAIPKCLADMAFLTRTPDFYFVPVSVKTALRGYQIREGFVVVDVEYNEHFGVICPDEDEEFFEQQDPGIGFGSSQLDSPHFHFFGNKGQAIVKTNYWDSADAAKGLFFLSWNAGAGRLLVPDNQKHLVREMKTAKYVIVSRGPWPEYGQMGIELLFEDHTDSPFSLQLSAEQSDRLFPETVQADGFVITVWTRGGEKVRRPGRFRDVPRIPCLDVWAPKRRH